MVLSKQLISHTLSAKEPTAGPFLVDHRVRVRWPNPGLLWSQLGETQSLDGNVFPTRGAYDGPKGGHGQGYRI